MARGRPRQQNELASYAAQAIQADLAEVNKRIEEDLLHKKELERLIRKYGLEAHAQPPDNLDGVLEETRRGAVRWAEGRVKARTNRRKARKGAKRRSWSNEQREAAAERMRQRWAKRKRDKKS